ncbi:MAG TPA: VIT domain-containing protein [Kofleriaceae bacterium]|nr:VIT domain-containing protein [Kofleriaceae bacterium]
MTRPTRDDDVLDANLGKLVPMADAPAMRADARDRIRTRLLATHARPARQRSRVAMGGWVLALGAATAIVVANVAGDGAGGGGSHDEHAVAKAGAKKPTDQVVLADGSTADLGPGGKVSVLGDRKVRITGAVLLDVIPGKGPFTVETANGRLDVIGTRFLVEASADRTVASVLRGAVAMKSAGGEEVVRAGEQGTMTAKSPPTRAPAPRLSHLVSWVAERRRRDETPATGPARSGVLVARNPMWQEQEFPLPLRSLTVDVHLENQIARVALDQTFHNPEPQQLEGVYKFALPPDAAVARLAMYVDGKLTESAVVERMRARRIYEEIVYTQRDPALMEQMGASKVSMRIFPLLPKQDKRVLLAYTQPLARTYDDMTLTVPMPDLEAPVAEVNMQVKVVGCGACEITSPSHKIELQRDGADAIVRHKGVTEALGDSLVLRVRKPDAPQVSVASTIHDARRYGLMRVRPVVDAAQAAGVTADRPHKWVILSDTSASRGFTERRAQAEMIDRLVQEIDEHDQVAIVAFDATHRRFAPFNDALAIDRKALGDFLVKDGGLGETDLVTSLEGAVKLLDGEPGYIVYLGDGTATGGRRTIDQLRDAVAGKATFIGVGVGDGTDMPTLSALADATSGMALHVDLGDDLAWRALDLVAALYTPRVTGLVATLETGGGQFGDDEVSAYLRSAQVAAGEDIEVVVRAPARAELTALVLRGMVAGRPWTQRIDLATAPRAPGDSGYLPRLWAERRIDHLMTMGDRALAPCTTTPCASDEERAIAAYHARKNEMVELGKAHFLLSPHTSLIVLENDAMYRQYGVEKGTGETWAPYAAPGEIPVVAQVAAPVIDNRPLWRFQTPWMYGDGGWAGDEWNGELQSGFGGRRGGEFRATSHFGKSGGTGEGTIGLGSGTGNGYGVGGGGKATTVATPAGQAAPADESGEAEKSKNGYKESFGFGQGRGDFHGDKDSGGADLTLALEEAPLAATSEPKLSDRSSPARDDAADGLFADAPAQPIAGGVLGSTTRGPRAEFWGDANSLDSGERGRWNRQQQAYWYGLNPTAFHYSSDYRLDDVTEWLPGFSRLGYDDLADALESAAAGGRGSISKDARALLDEARTKLGAGRWVMASGGEIVVDAQGRIEATRTLETGVQEVMTFDGITLAHRYPSLGLETTRAATDREPALLASYLPVVAPRADALARWYHVTVSDPRTLRLTPMAKSALVWELKLDDFGAVVSMAVVRGTDRKTVLTATRDGSGYTLSAGGESETLRFTADARAQVSSTPAQQVSIGMPMGAPVVVRATLDGMSAGDPARRRVMHQLAAASLAARDVGGLAGVAVMLADLGPLSSAELALVGSSLAWVPGDKVDAVLGKSTTAGAYDPMAAYLRASLDLRLGKRADFDSVGARSSGIVSLLADYRAALQKIEQNDTRAAMAAFDTFASRHLRADTLRLIAALRLVQIHAYRSSDAVSVLDRVADGAWRNLARQEAARYLANKPAEAAERWVALLSDVDLTAAPPMVDWNARNSVVSSARGEVGWQLAMSAWRQRVIAGGNFEHVLAFARAAAFAPASGDLDAALDRAAMLAPDADAVAVVVGMATQYGKFDKARAALDGARARFPNSPRLLRLASVVAEQAGDVRLAADLFTQALKAESDTPVALSQLRADFTRVISLYGQVAKASGDVERLTARDAAIAAGRDWRAIDPDFAPRERALGELLFALGEEDEAWRYISTPIDLAPREGASFQAAAEVLERQGRLVKALGLWKRAFAIDATNPTWLQRAAQLELALGQRDEAHFTLQKIAKGNWHQRYAGVKYWADNALRTEAR